MKTRVHGFGSPPFGVAAMSSPVQTAPAYVNSSFASDAVGADTFVMPAPTGLTVGQPLIAFILCYPSGPSNPSTPPAGWTALDAKLHLKSWWRAYDGSANYTWNKPVGSTNLTWIGGMIAFASGSVREHAMAQICGVCLSPCPTPDPPDTYCPSSVIIAPPITPSGNSAVAGWWATHDSGGTISIPSGWASRQTGEVVVAEGGSQIVLASTSALGTVSTGEQDASPLNTRGMGSQVAVR